MVQDSYVFYEMEAKTLEDNHPVFDYSNFRQFLNDHYQSKRENIAHWSFGMWSKKLKIKSPSTLIMILNGQRNPGVELINKFKKYFSMKEAAGEYFEDLIRLEKVKNDVPLSVMLMEKLNKSHRSGQFRYLDFNTFSAIANWYYYAIREMVNLSFFKEDPIWISSVLQYKVTPKEIKTAISTLLKLNLLTRDQENKLVPTDKHISTNNDVAHEGIKRHHEQTLGQVKTSLRKDDPKIREISGVCFALKRSKLPEAKKLIHQFQRKFCEMIETKDADSVYQLEVSFIPLTKDWSSS